MAANTNAKKTLEARAAAAPTDLHKAFADWLYIQTGVKVDLKTVQLVTTMRHDFQRSEENQQALAARKANAAKTKKAAAARKAAKLEAELAEIRKAAGEAKAEEPKVEEAFEEPVRVEKHKLTVVYGNNEPQVHKAGCADIKKARRRGTSQETMSVASHTELTCEIYSDMIDSGESSVEDNYMAYDFKPCCPKLAK